MVAIKHGVALVLLLAVLGLSTALAASPRKQGPTTHEEVKKVVEAQHPHLSARVLSSQTSRVVGKANKLASQRALGKTKSAAEVAEYKKHSSKHSGYDKDHKDYKHKDYAPKGDYYPKGDYHSKGDYPSGYGGDYNPGYGYGPPAPVTPLTAFDINVDFYYSGKSSDTGSLNQTLAYGWYYAEWAASSPESGDPYYGKWLANFERGFLMVLDEVTVDEGTAGSPSKLTVKGFLTDHSETVYDYWDQDFDAFAGYTEIDMGGTYPAAFSVKNWHIDGVPLPTKFYYLGPEGIPWTCGKITDISPAPPAPIAEDTTVLHAMDPMWGRVPIQISVDFAQGCP